MNAPCDVMSVWGWIGRPAEQPLLARPDLLLVSLERVLARCGSLLVYSHSNKAWARVFALVREGGCTALPFHRRRAAHADSFLTWDISCHREILIRPTKKKSCVNHWFRGSLCRIQHAQRRQRICALPYHSSSCCPFTVS